jgi:hypothetical protein
MRIIISLNENSIKEAIKQVEEIKKKISNELPRVFLLKCVEWIKITAISNLDLTDLSSDVVKEVENGWQTEFVASNIVRLINTADRATYLEFGVGSVGKQQSHSKAGELGYEYDVPSSHKQADGTWKFYIDKNDGVDLNVGFYTVHYTKGQKKEIVTKGSPANMFLFKAIKEFETTGIYKLLWKQSKEEVIK